MRSTSAPHAAAIQASRTGSSANRDRVVGVANGTDANEGGGAKMTKRLQIAGAAIAAVLATAPSGGWAQETQLELGEDEFIDNCAVCHGRSAKGDGPLADRLTEGGQTIPDLTALSAKNGGPFPFERVLDIIDGRADVHAHGPRDMTVWGQVFKSQASPNLSADFQELLVRGRILTLIEYLRSLQQFP